MSFLFWSTDLPKCVRRFCWNHLYTVVVWGVGDGRVTKRPENCIIRSKYQLYIQERFVASIQQRASAQGLRINYLIVTPCNLVGSYQFSRHTVLVFRVHDTVRMELAGSLETLMSTYWPWWHNLEHHNPHICKWYNLKCLLLNDQFVLCDWK